jgi:hypothetical protein
MSDEFSMDPNADPHLRLQNLETAFTQSQQTTNTRLEQLTEVIHQLLDAQPTQPAPPPPPPTPARTSGNTKRRVKVASPPDFDGSRQSGRAFLNNCKLYLELNSDVFSNDQERIHWALSYFKSGRAARFADRILRAERDQTSLIETWRDFEKDFVQRFCEVNERVNALTRLEGTSWHQRGIHIDDYIDTFEDLVSLAQLETDVGLVMKFRRGLNGILQDKIAEMQDAPDLDNLNAWKSAARRVYQNIEANRAFTSGPRNLQVNAPRVAPPVKAMIPRTTIPASFPVAALPFKATEPSVVHRSKTDEPTPMEVDATRQRRSLPLICFRCREPGHRASECPRRFDVRSLVESLEADERQELLETLLVEADLAGVQTNAESREADFQGDNE